MKESDGIRKGLTPLSTATHDAPWSFLLRLKRQRDLLPNQDLTSSLPVTVEPRYLDYRLSRIPRYLERFSVPPDFDFTFENSSR